MSELFTQDKSARLKRIGRFFDYTVTVNMGN